MVTIPQPAIQKAINQACAASSVQLSDSELMRIVGAIEWQLAAGGFVNLSNDELADRIEEGSYEANYEDGQ